MSQGLIELIRPYISLISWEAFLKHLADIMDTDEKTMELPAKKQVVYVLMNFTLLNVISHSLMGYFELFTQESHKKSPCFSP